MSIKISKLSLKNFLSIGAVPQSIDFDREDLTLILGENLDLGGDGARNGTGKTTIIQGLSYSLFGVAINNIKKDNLINRTNAKNMLSTVEFSARGVDYKIVRGRKPNILKFYVNNQEQNASEATDDSQGDSRETQDAIERVLCMSADVFKHIVALNTYNEPFLALKASDQRTIIEQMLGITLLSEKAESIKELNKKTKEDIQSEEYRVRGQEEANRRIQDQIDSLRKRQRLWNAKHHEDLDKLVVEYDELSKIDIATELRAHRELTEYNKNKIVRDTYDSMVARQTAWAQRQNIDISELESELNKLNKIDITSELQSHRDLVTYTEQLRLSTERDAELKRIKKDLDRETKNWTKLDSEVETLKQNRCYACNQEFHDLDHANVLSKKVIARDESLKQVECKQRELGKLESAPVFVSSKPNTHYSTESAAIKHSTELENLVSKIQNKKNEPDPYQEHIDEIKPNLIDLGLPPKTVYDTEDLAVKHSGRIDTLLAQIEQKHNETDPYSEQLAEMEATGLQAVSFDKINNLTRLLQHQDYLLDLLTNKKSFVRKRIIDQNLSHLNARLTHYLDKMGLPHQVVFQNDLSVEITEFGREMDFHNLSRGEMNRLVLSLSFAFRDVWESLYSPCNILFIDELLDSGMDTIGTENSLALLKDLARRRNKSVWLVSHKDELVGRVDSVLKVIKESGFTSYANSTENVE